MRPVLGLVWSAYMRVACKEKVVTTHRGYCFSKTSLQIENEPRSERITTEVSKLRFSRRLCARSGSTRFVRDKLVDAQAFSQVKATSAANYVYSFGICFGNLLFCSYSLLRRGLPRKTIANSLARRRKSPQVVYAFMADLLLVMAHHPHGYGLWELTIFMASTVIDTALATIPQLLTTKLPNSISRSLKVFPSRAAGLSTETSRSAL